MAQDTRGVPGTTVNAVHWRRLRREVIDETDRHCERCGQPRPEAQLHLHHLTYDRIGVETRADVQLLCSRCHRIVHLARPELVRPAPRPVLRGSRRQRIGAIVKVIRAGTVCETCGDPAKKIEWHHDDHPAHPELRIANLVDDGKPIEVVIAEIERCEAVCRKCHIRSDGRGVRLSQSGGRRAGEANGRAKLTAAQVEEIRAAYATDSRHGRQAELSRQYGVAPPTLNHILRGRCWPAA